MSPRPLAASPQPAGQAPPGQAPPGQAPPGQAPPGQLPQSPLGLAAGALKQRIDSHGPQLKLTGEAAMKAAGDILPTAHVLLFPSSLGTVKLVPGTVWAGRRMLVYAAPLYCYFTVDDRLYEWQTWRFVQDEWFHALATGASRAEYWESVAKAEIALLSGIFFPWYVLLGIACARISLLYIEHREVVDEVFARAPKVMGALRTLRARHPVLFEKLLRRVATEVVSNLGEGVTASDVAFFVGRVIRGAASAAPGLSLLLLARICVVTGAIVSVTHLPNISAHVAAQEAKKHAAEYQQKLAEAGYSVTLEEAEAILKDSLSRGDPKQTLEALERAVTELMPSLEQLTKAIQL